MVILGNVRPLPFSAWPPIHIHHGFSLFVGLLEGIKFFIIGIEIHKALSRVQKIYRRCWEKNIIYLDMIYIQKYHSGNEFLKVIIIQNCIRGNGCLKIFLFIPGGLKSIIYVLSCINSSKIDNNIEEKVSVNLSFEHEQRESTNNVILDE